jgi:hypothetical protein
VKTSDRWLIPSLVAVWLGIAAVGFGTLWAYDNRPGTAATAPRNWPAGTRLATSAARPTLVVFAHPRCSCTRATLAELAEVLSRARVQPHTFVVFLHPDGFERDWEVTALWRQAAALPGVTVLRDDSGEEATRFGVATSGQTVLYDARGALRFSGGITGSRGHEGENASEQALLESLNAGVGGIRTSVFGCPLFSSLL